MGETLRMPLGLRERNESSGGDWNLIHDVLEFYDCVKRERNESSGGDWNIHLLSFCPTCGLQERKK